MASLKNRSLKKGCVSDLFALLKGGVYTFLVRRFFVCAYLVVARIGIFFCIRFICVLFSLRKFVIFSVWGEFSVHYGGENRNFAYLRVASIEI